MKIGGPARFFARISSESHLLEAVRFARARNLPVFTLGGGSNLVVSDEGFPGLILSIMLPASIELSQRSGEVLVEVSAGTDWNDLVLHLCRQGISGMECLAGIPGLVGGAPIQNIGAYGQEVSQSIAGVRALDLESLAFVELPAAECRFSYRTSLFNSMARNRYIVTSVRFRLDPDATPNLTYADLRRHFGPDAHPTPLQVYEAVRQIRAGKGMLIEPAHPTPDSRSAGSFFKNPVVAPEVYLQAKQLLRPGEADVPHWIQPSGNIKLAAAWLIERAGISRGFSLFPESRVGISTRHTLALVNRTGDATCAELLQLRDHIKRRVSSRHGVSLEQEPVSLH